MSEVEQFYLRHATGLIDHMFELGYFSNNLTRQDLRQLDELFGFMLQSTSESAVKATLLTRRIREKPDTPQDAPGSVSP